MVFPAKSRCFQFDVADATPVFVQWMRLLIALVAPASSFILRPESS